jgi:phosphonoacetaldehyde hydrolase
MFTYQRRYRGPVQAVILDWAGTTVDFGCLAPAAVFQRIFEEAGVPVSIAEARAVMGLHKRDHIAAMLAEPDIARRWRQVHGADPGEAEVERLFDRFVPQQLAALADHLDLIPGAADALAAARARGLAVGSTSGYTREMMDRVMPAAADQGYAPDATVCVSEVPRGRPAPFMLHAALAQLDAWPVSAVVKVGDTVSDVEEGLNAGCWTVSTAVSGNEVGLSHADWSALSAERRADLRDRAARRLRQAGAHLVIDTVAELDTALDEIEARLARGEMP